MDPPGARLRPGGGGGRAGKCRGAGDDAKNRNSSILGAVSTIRLRMIPGTSRVKNDVVRLLVSEVLRKKYL